MNFTVPNRYGPLYSESYVNELVSRICQSCGDRTDIGKANLWFVLKCRSSPAVILHPFRIGSELQPSQTIIYVRFDRAGAIKSLLVDIKYTYHDILAGRSGETPGTIFPPCSKPTLRMRIPSTASFADKEPTRVFQTARAFHPVAVCLHTAGTLITLAIPSLTHAQFIAFPAGLGLAVVVC